MITVYLNLEYNLNLVFKSLALIPVFFFSALLSMGELLPCFILVFHFDPLAYCSHLYGCSSNYILCYWHSDHFHVGGSGIILHSCQYLEQFPSNPMIHRVHFPQGQILKKKFCEDVVESRTFLLKSKLQSFC